MATYHFVLWLEDSGVITCDLEDRVYEAGCSDALLGIYNGRMFLEFDRESDSLLEAVVTAIEDAYDAGLMTQRISFDVEDFVTQAEIARRTERTSASISQLISGDRGPGDFPAPFRMAGTTKVWLWSEVNAWFVGSSGSPLEGCADCELQGIASAYQFVRSVPDAKRREQIVNRLASVAH